MTYSICCLHQVNSTNHITGCMYRAVERHRSLRYLFIYTTNAIDFSRTLLLPLTPYINMNKKYFAFFPLRKKTTETAHTADTYERKR